MVMKSTYRLMQQCRYNRLHREHTVMHTQEYIESTWFSIHYNSSTVTVTLWAYLSQRAALFGSIGNNSQCTKLTEKTKKLVEVTVLQKSPCAYYYARIYIRVYTTPLIDFYFFIFFLKPIIINSTVIRRSENKGE